MKRILILDTETSGLDPAKDRIIELGVVLWSVEHRCVLEAYSGLMSHYENQAEAVNGIPLKALVDDVIDDDLSWKLARDLSAFADAVVAHNAEFDRAFVLPKEHLFNRPWVCSANDIAWPRASDSRSLVALCLAHGVGVSHAHRALTDCLLLARLFERVAEMGHDVNRLLEDALLPRITLQALHKFEDNDKAKAAGFRFDGATKRWLKRVRKDQPGEYPFRIREAQ